MAAEGFRSYLVELRDALEGFFRLHHMHPSANGRICFQGQSKKSLSGNSVGHKPVVTLPPSHRILGQIAEVLFGAEIITLAAQECMQLIHIRSFMPKAERAGSEFPAW